MLTTGQSQTISPPQSIVVMVGEDIVLPCQLEPPTDAVQMTVEWGRPDLNPRFVYVWHNGQELLVDQNTAYEGRASISVNYLKQGDISLKLSKVKISDNGIYRCYVPKQSKEHFIELVVGAFSPPSTTLAGLDRSSSGVVLQCESKGWYPEPELLWLDAEGKILSAGPTETVRGPDDLYTVSSRVTVEKRHSNNITCRVQERNINQTRETQMHVPGQSQLICSSESVAAQAGEDVILPCRLYPPIRASSRTVEWTRPGLDPEYIHVHQDGRLVYQSQNPLYSYRTTLFVDQLVNGNVSLKIFNVKMSDAGKYKCFLPSLWKEAFIQLTVGSTSSPVIAGIERNSGELVLQCESKGWYPEPELLWLDAEGKILSAGPTETVRGPDDLYTVSSRLTVEKIDNITCRVQQSNINQTRETHIYVTETKLHVENGNEQIMRQKSATTVHSTTEEQSLVKEKRKRSKKTDKDTEMKYLNKRKEKLDDEIKKKKEEQKDVTEMIDALEAQREELQKVTQEVRERTKRIEKLMEENEAEANALDNETGKKLDKAQRYSKLKRIMSEGNSKVKTEIQQQQSLELNTSKLLVTTEAVLQKMTDWKKEIERNIKQSTMI
ncbi:butyrophilin-like protein 2 [Anabas testudineus]|uniref:butyrophilin-like protein 2 n=1 Tax=Anabas testudineus TaxID=64144 RepID=UPI00143CF998|nr:butyrophilin-like protein 2 [Anabas testudineus]